MNRRIVEIVSDPDLGVVGAVVDTGRIVTTAVHGENNIIINEARFYRESGGRLLPLPRGHA